jgi:hypothetical protein
MVEHLKKAREEARDNFRPRIIRVELWLKNIF